MLFATLSWLLFHFYSCVRTAPRVSSSQAVFLIMMAHWFARQAEIWVVTLCFRERILITIKILMCTYSCRRNPRFSLVGTCTIDRFRVCNSTSTFFTYEIFLNILRRLETHLATTAVGRYIQHHCDTAAGRTSISRVQTRSSCTTSTHRSPQSTSGTYIPNLINLSKFDEARSTHRRHPMSSYTSAGSASSPIY